MKILPTYLLKKGNDLMPFAFSHNPNIAVLTQVHIGTVLLIINGKNSEASMYLVITYSTYMTIIQPFSFTGTFTQKLIEIRAAESRTCLHLIYCRSV